MPAHKPLSRQNPPANGKYRHQGAAQRPKTSSQWEKGTLKEHPDAQNIQPVGKGDAQKSLSDRKHPASGGFGSQWGDLGRSGGFGPQWGIRDVARALGRPDKRGKCSRAISPCHVIVVSCNFRHANSIRLGIQSPPVARQFCVGAPRRRRVAPVEAHPVRSPAG